MDAGTASVILGIITGIFGVITAIINKRQKSVEKRVEKQALFVRKEKGLRQKLNQKEKEREETIHDVMILILDTNLNILKNQNPEIVDDEIFRKSEELKQRFSYLSESIDNIYKEYELVLSMTEEFEADLNGKN